MTEEAFDRAVAEMIRDGELEVLISEGGEVLMMNPEAFVLRDQTLVEAEFLT